MLLLLALACVTEPTSDSGVDDGSLLDGDCDPLVPEVCGLPFPSNVYLRDDSSTVTGKRVAFKAGTLPVSVDGYQSNPDNLNLADGFSPAAGPLAFLPGATNAGFAGPNTPELSLTDTSPTVILDAETGERIAHFAELDRSHDDDSRRAINLRPMTLLTPGHRYIVALRNVLDSSGAPVAPNDTFRALRDGTDSTEVSVDRRRELYDDIFARLDEAGVAREELQLAWDFSVASRESATDRLLHMRDAALVAIGSGASYTFTEIDTAPEDEHLAVRIEGTVSVPLFLDNGGPGGVLVLADDGLPEQNGTFEYPFVLLVPNACVGVSCPIVQYGHGLFGDRYSVDTVGYAEAADTFGAVVISMDWIGMSGDDIPEIAGAAAAGDIDQFATIPDRSQQGMVNLAVALRTLMGPMAEDPALIFDGIPAVDPNTRYYLGGSQGGIYGATYMAITPDIERGVLVVPGAAYSLMLPRSVYWASYATPFVVNRFEDPRTVQLVLGYVQMLWDRAEPSGYASAITGDPFAGTPTHHVMLMEGVGDHQVPNLSTELLARSIGASYLGPGNRVLYGLPAVEGPISESNTLLDFDYGLGPVPEENVPMTEGADPHDAVFFEPAVQAAFSTFLKTGMAVNYCEGACDPG
ncbi:hypothetical protein LBMAG42_50050 [Deltaproteobacteria bacterium]|nr:hypothetical protein LBMAG42_50050 [Deltaproteobacteria bacterium]